MEVSSWIPSQAVLLSLAAMISFVLISLIYSKLTQKRDEFKGKHVLITGGSKGLGFALAQQLAVDHQAWVTICARKEDDLSKATKSIRDLFSKDNLGRIQGITCDVTDSDNVEKMISNAEGTFGSVTVLICCAGQAATGEFTNMKIQDFRDQMDLNYLGTVYPTRIIVNSMIQEKRKGGRIVFVASQAALTSLMGYAAYAPSKFAVRGLAESLRHELLPHSIKVQIAFPGNMDSPGYENEQKTKPEITKKFEALEPLQKPRDVAKAVLSSIEKDEFAIYGGNMSGYFLGRMSRGLGPYGNNLITDAILSPFLVIFGWGHRTFLMDRAHNW